MQRLLKDGGHLLWVVPSGMDVQTLASADRIHVGKARVDAGLWSASIFASLEDFTETEKYYFSKGVQQRLRYTGNDPAVFMELSAHKTTATQNSCIGAPNWNLVGEGNFQD